MSDRSTKHSTFTIERTYDASPERVFAAWSDPQAKARWFGPSDKPEDAYSLEFRVGGRERLTIAMPDGPSYTLNALYQDIVPGQRIIYSYDIHRGEDRISVSLASVEIHALDAGTRLTLVEHGVFLDGLDTPEAREHGTNVMMDTLGSVLHGSGEDA